MRPHSLGQRMTHRPSRLARAQRFIAVTAGAIAVILTSQAPVSAQPADPVERWWYDGTTRRTIWMAPDRLGVVFDPASIPKSRAEAEQRVGRSLPGASLDSQEGAVAIFRLQGAAGTAGAAREVRSERGVRHASAVYYQGSRGPGNPLVLSGEILVGFRGVMSPDDLARFSRKYGVVLMRPLGVVPNTFLFDARAAADSLALANAIFETGQVTLAQPNWIQSAARR